MKTIAAAFFVLVCLATFSYGQKLKSKDLDKLGGAQWVGNLTYRDYSSDKKVSISCNLAVTKSGKKNSWIFSYLYPKEPKANSADTVVLSDDGKIFDKEMVIERTKLADGTLKFVTQKEGSDNDKKAMFRFTYLIGDKTFSLKKEVKYLEGSADYFERNEYKWTR
jgi:hypothetical protein